MAQRRDSQTGARLRRAVILATLTCILFAVAGVTAATENRFTLSSQDEDQTESTVPEPTVAGGTAPEVTALEATVPETTVPQDVEKPIEGTVVVHEEPKEPGKEDPGTGNYGGIQNDKRIEKAGAPTGKPEHAQGGKKYGKPRVAGKPPGKSGPATGKPDHAGEKGFDGKSGKVTLCHKGRVTNSVGAPAVPAHLRHGDTIGAC
jgi:hypothetical protein